MDAALLSFADLWGRNSEYFKRSLHLIKSSTAEPDEAQRIITLNRALDISLEGTESLMDSFAAKLKTPSCALLDFHPYPPCPGGSPACSHGRWHET